MVLRGQGDHKPGCRSFWELVSAYVSIAKQHPDAVGEVPRKLACVCAHRGEHRLEPLELGIGTHEGEDKAAALGSAVIFGSERRGALEQGVCAERKRPRRTNGPAVRSSGSRPP